MGYIYMITKELCERMRNHKKKTSNCRALKEAMDALGRCGFEIQLICICFDEDMNKIEQQYIAKFNSIAPYGYNLRAGGNSSRHCNETKQKISAAMTGKPGWNKGKVGEYITSQETKDKISASLKAHYASRLPDQKVFKAREKSWKKVYKYDTSGELIQTYESGKAAAADLQVATNAVSRACLGQRKTPLKGFILKFASSEMADNQQKNNTDANSTQQFNASIPG